MKKKLLFTLFFASVDCTINSAEAQSCKTPALIQSATTVSFEKEPIPSKTFKNSFTRKRAERKAAKQKTPQPDRLELLRNRFKQLTEILEQQRIFAERVERGEISRKIDIPDLFQLQHFQELSNPNYEQDFKKDQYYNLTSDDELKELVEIYTNIAKENRKKLIERTEQEIIKITEEIKILEIKNFTEKIVSENRLLYPGIIRYTQPSKIDDMGINDID